MKCVKCKSEQLFGAVKVELLLPFGKKGGNIVTAGHTVTQVMQESWWLQRDGVDQLMLGPVLCVACGEEHTYFKGLTPALRAVPYAEALQYGYDHYASGAAPKPEADEDPE